MRKRKKCAMSLGLIIALIFSILFVLCRHPKVKEELEIRKFCADQVPNQKQIEALTNSLRQLLLQLTSINSVFLPQDYYYCDPYQRWIWQGDWKIENKSCYRRVQVIIQPIYDSQYPICFCSSTVENIDRNALRQGFIRGSEPAYESGNLSYFLESPPQGIVPYPARIIFLKSRIMVNVNLWPRACLEDSQSFLFDKEYPALVKDLARQIAQTMEGEKK